MTIELKMLALSVVLGLIQIVLASHAGSLQLGYRWTASPRDEMPPLLTGVAGRLDRALRNFLETFPFFAAAVITAHIVNRHDWLTEGGVQLYFWARIVYVALLCAWRSIGALIDLELGDGWYHHGPFGAAVIARLYRHLHWSLGR